MLIGLLQRGRLFIHSYVLQLLIYNVAVNNTSVFDSPGIVRIPHIPQWYKHVQAIHFIHSFMPGHARSHRSYRLLFVPHPIHEPFTVYPITPPFSQYFIT